MKSTTELEFDAVVALRLLWASFYQRKTVMY